MKYEVYFWHEEGEIPLAADHILDRIAENRNLPGVDRLSLAAINRVLSHHFPNIVPTDDGLRSTDFDGSFNVSFSFDDSQQPTVICISSEHPVDETPKVFERLFHALRELGCNRFG